MKRKYAHLRKELQAKGTRSAKRKLRSLAGRERRFMLHFNHSLAKKIATLPYGTFALEDLKGIRKQRRGKAFNRRRSNWAYFQFRRLLTYKAQERGKNILLVSPSYTSQTCSRCLSIHKQNRNGSIFQCKQCGFLCHADLNASVNISQRGYDILLGQAAVNQPHISDDESRGCTSPEIMKILEV